MTSSLYLRAAQSSVLYHCMHSAAMRVRTVALWEATEALQSAAQRGWTTLPRCGKRATRLIVSGLTTPPASCTICTALWHAFTHSRRRPSRLTRVCRTCRWGTPEAARAFERWTAIADAAAGGGGRIPAAAGCGSGGAGRSSAGAGAGRERVRVAWRRGAAVWDEPHLSAPRGRLWLALDVAAPGAGGAARAAHDGDAARSLGAEAQRNDGDAATDDLDALQIERELSFALRRRACCAAGGARAHVRVRVAADERVPFGAARLFPPEAPPRSAGVCAGAGASRDADPALLPSVTLCVLGNHRPPHTSPAPVQVPGALSLQPQTSTLAHSPHHTPPRSRLPRDAACPISTG